MSNQYNPFNKELRDVKEEDLEILRGIGEGQFVEYKSEKPNGKKIAKSIASFANSHGGIYFLGIESDTSDNLASGFPGVEDSPDVIRDSVVNNLQPFPNFQTYVIPLINGGKIVMVSIPDGENPPYIHSNGRIYRRQEGGSDPIVPETNRYAIDELYKKSTKYFQQIDKFRKNQFDFSHVESEFPHLLIYINPMPFKRFQLNDFKSWNKNDVLNFFRGTSKLHFNKGATSLDFSMNIPFDTFSTYSNSFVLRAMKGRDLSYNGLTIEIDVFGNCRILIPLDSCQSNNSGVLKKRYLNILNEYDSDSITHLKILDGSKLGHTVLAIFNLYKEFLLEKNFSNNLEMKLELINCHRTTLYFESDNFLEHIEKFGIPVCMKNNQYFPEIPLFWRGDELKNNSLIDCMTIFSQIGMALGVPSTIVSNSYIHSLANRSTSQKTPSSTESTPPSNTDSPIE